MAPYKLEDNIRKKLERRELEPSVGAWGKLEAKLDEQQPKKKARGWYYIAASFIGILVLVSVFSSRNNEGQKDQIVNESIERQGIERQSEKIIKNAKPEKIAFDEVDSEIDNTKSKKGKNADLIRSVQQKESAVKKKFKKNKVIAKATDKAEDLSAESVIHNSKEDEVLFNQKIDEVTASIKQLQETNSEVTAREVEQLLNDARREIQTQQILSSSKVDAMALLQDVEWELEKSFRDKVFDALGEGFRKIRTAVIERNN
ncbi:hypothetical protein [Aequorivita marina]|uniref:hypothetical protein n=1 Tax=Aequorivita marina TaxID=3073654 RepID=UPI002875D1AE|nr:hypothetical protein [Aequorivita sp. S2608]MDS1296966.1 hypothetical protein [Aequorivita sp. S2608]